MKSRNQKFQQTFEIVHHLLLTVVQAFESISYASTASFSPLQVSSSECSEKWTFGEHMNLKFSLSNCLRPVQSVICNTIWQMKCSCFLISELELGVQFLCPCWDFVLIWFVQVSCLFVVYFIFLHAIMPAIICSCPPLSEDTISIYFFITFDFYAPSAPSSSVIPEILEEVIKYICCI